MKLVTLGKVGLTGCAFSRPKPLLLLCYLTLEGPQERRRLASLFWHGEDDKSGLQKKLGKLSVVLAQFKKEGAGEVFPDKPGIDPLPSRVACDALEFLDALGQGALEKAVSLYSGPFLQGFDKHISGLELSGELSDWLLETREALAQKAQAAMLELAEASLRAGQPEAARTLAERAYTLAGAPGLEPQELSRFHEVLSRTGSNVSGTFSHLVDTSLDELPEGVRRVFLALALQAEPNLTVVRSALKLSLSDVSEAHECLIGEGLIAPQAQLLAPELARRWLEAHPRDALPLLLALARATPAEDALRLYRRVYRQTQGFGGVGDFSRARAAYCKEAKALSDRLEFAEAAALLAELHGVERVLEAEADSESRFLEGYALERTGRYKEALDTLYPLPADAYNPNLTALKSVLLWRRGKSEEARAAAEEAIGSGLDWLWARATAHNTLGYLAYAGEDFLAASSYFKKAASLFQTCGEANRHVGSLNNHANALDTMAEVEERKGTDAATVGRLRDEAEEAYKSALAALESLGKNETLRARILLNIGMLWEYRKDWDEAEKYYLEALPVAKTVSNLELVARLHQNLGNALFMRQRLSEARHHHQQAITFATKGGDSFIQGLAAANLANMDNDPDGMEVALELLEQSGDQDRLNFFQNNYEAILKIRLNEALTQNDLGKSRFLFSKLEVLYQKQQQVDKACKVKDALAILTHIPDQHQRKTLLLELFDDETSAHASPTN